MARSDWIDLPSGVKQEDVVRFAEGIVESAKRARNESPEYAIYKKGLDYYLGEHKIKKRSEKKGNQVYNKMAEIISNRLAHIVLKNAKWRFRPQEESDVIDAGAYNELIGDFLWDYIEWHDKSEDSMLECVFAGTNFVKTRIDIERDGLPNFHPISMKNILYDRKASKKRNMRFIVHLYSKSISKIRDTYGVNVSAETDLSDTDRQKDAYDVEYTYKADTTTNKMPNIWEMYGDNTKGTVPDWFDKTLGEATIAEIWLDDYKMERIPYDEEETNLEHAAFNAFQPVQASPEENHPAHIKAHTAYLETLSPENDKQQIQDVVNHIEEHNRMPDSDTEKRYKYPYGRVIAICQGKLLKDQSVADLYPFDWKRLWISYEYEKIPNRLIGKSLTADLFDPQDDYNHRKNAITQNINLLNNGIKKVAFTTFAKLKGNLNKFNNMIGNVFPVKNKDDVSVDFGTPLPPQFFQDLIYSEQSMDRRAGENEVMSGRYPGGSPPGVTVNQLLAQGMQRINLIVRHYAYALQEMARNALVIMASERYVSPDLKVRILNNEKKYEMIEWGKIREHMGKVDIRIDVDAMLASSRQELLQLAIELYQAGIYDRWAVLQKVDDPDKYETMQRVSEILIMQQQMEGMSEENDQLKKQLNTLYNRLQSQEGQGNVGTKQTTP